MQFIPRSNLRRSLVAGLFGVATLLPGAAYAQETPDPINVQAPNEASFCGSLEVPMVRPGELLVPQPDTLDKLGDGMPQYSAVRGQIVHMAGDLVLLKIDNLGMGNAAPNRVLAGDDWAVVHLPSECAPSSFHMGAPIIAIGTPTPRGILEAVQVSETA
jgi:hypothetical protein